MKKIICLLMALALTLSFAACSESEEPKATTAAPTTEAATETTAEATTEVATENTTEAATEATGEAAVGALTQLSVTYGANYEDVNSVSAMINEDGTVYVEYLNEVRKVNPAMDASVMETITAALNESGLVAMNGTQEWGEGEASCSLFASFADETFMSVDITGAEVNADFLAGYEIMKAAFAEILADTPEYVPQPSVMGEVDETLFAEINGILTASGLEPLDAFGISQIVDDENFGFATGLTDATGVQAAASLTHGMMTTAYSMVMVTLTEDADAAAIAADFEANIDWLKWVCVQPSNALIAQKDNMILCLMADGDAYTATASAIEAAGWTEVKALSNPNME